MGYRHLVTKIQDEMRALQLCQSKMRQKKLPMEVIDAEYQWCVAIVVRMRVPLMLCTGIAESQRFTLLQRNASISESLYENCFGASRPASHALTLTLGTVGIKHGSGWPLFRALVNTSSRLDGKPN